MSGFLGQAFAYLAAAVVAVVVAKRLGLGSVLGYLLAGVAIGPFGLGLIGAEGQDVMHVAEFGVVMMLFAIGLELDPAAVWRMRARLLALGGGQVVVTAAAAAVVAMLAGFGWRPAAALGLIVALSSTAIVLQSLQERGWLAGDGGQKSFAVLLFQDIAVIPILAVLPLLADPGARAADAAAAHGATLVDHLPAWGRALATVGAVAAVVAGARYAIGPAFRYIARARLREVFTAAALLLVIGIALLMQLVGLSPALGAFVGGVVLAGSEFRHELEGDLEPFKGLLLGLFFLAVGASLDFALVADRAGVVSAVVAALIVGKGIVLWALGGGRGTLPDQRLLFAVALAQGGEFAFVLLAFAAQNAVLAPDVTAVVTAAVALSMALTPVLFVLYDRVLRPRFLSAAPPSDRAADEVHGDAPVLILGYGHFGSTVGRLVRAAGFRQTVLEFDSERVERLRRLGFDVYYGDASREELLRAAGADTARLALICLSDADRTRAINETFRRHFPHVTVLARAAGRFEAYDLLNAGVERVYRDTLDTALRMGADALAHLGVARHAAVRAAQAFRKHDERNLRVLAPTWRSDGYVSDARRVIEEIEQALRDDVGRGALRDDSAWDATSLREEYRDLGR